MFNFLYFAFMMLFPFYFFASGQPQISHIVLAGIFFMVFIFLFKEFIDTISKNRNFIIFLAYVAYVNIFWLIITSKVSFFINTLFYVFNILVFYSTYMLNNLNFIDTKKLRYAIFSSMMLQLILLIAVVGIDLNHRSTLYFNNPNQLGYFVVATINIYFILGIKRGEEIENRSKIDMLISFILYLVAFFIIIVSSSKSAIVSYMIVMIMILYYSMVKRASYSKYIVATIISAIVIATLVYNISYIADSIEGYSAVDRLTKAGTESDDSIEGRGYDRILLYIQYTLLGAGEGYTSRFVLSHHHGELHSTIASVLFSYGLIGFLLFASLFFNKNYHIIRVLFYMSPIMVYGLAHNGIRSPLFWIALALSMNYSIKKGTK